jgi:hypothetical protein
MSRGAGSAQTIRLAGPIINLLNCLLRTRMVCGGADLDRADDQTSDIHTMAGSDITVDDQFSAEGCHSSIRGGVLSFAALELRSL